MGAVWRCRFRAKYDFTWRSAFWVAPHLNVERTQFGKKRVHWHNLVLIGQINQEVPNGPTDRILPQFGLSRKWTS